MTSSTKNSQVISNDISSAGKFKMQKSKSDTNSVAVITRSLRKKAPKSSTGTYYVYHSILVFIYLFIWLQSLVLYNYHQIIRHFNRLLYHHNRTPQLIHGDVADLEKVPKRVAVILDIKENEEDGGLDGLMDHVGEIAAWCLGGGISYLTVYEKSGILKKYYKETFKVVGKRLESYHGKKDMPNYKLHIPHYSISMTANEKKKINIIINLISLEDGRETIIDLTKTLADMAVSGDLNPKDVNIPIIDNELKTLVMEEPDLLITFGPKLDLEGFPPWHIRLCEIYCEPDNNEVTYLVFIHGLQTYSRCKINVGK